jgi:hypothetical protein
MGSPIDGRKGPSATKKAAATAARLLFPIVVGAVVAMAGVSLVAQPIWGDQSWLLYAASRILDGGRIGSDIVETNPPTIIWLSEIPVLLSRLLGVSPEAAMKICLGLLLFLSTTWCGSMVRRIPRAGSGAMAVWLAIGIAYGTTVYSWSDVGQREYILVLLMLPYLVMAALRLNGVSPAAWPAFTAGVITVVGLSMKPQHILIVAGIELLLACRIGLRRSVTRPEAAGGVIGGLAYCAAIAIFAPDYVTKVVPVVYRTYLDYQTLPLLTLIEPRRTAKLAALLLLWAFMRRRLQYRSLCDVLAIAGVGAAAAYLIQQKGWQYQFLPADAYFILLFAVIVADIFLQWTASLTKPALRMGFAGATALLSCALVAALYYPIQSAKAAAGADPDRVVVQRAILSALPAGTTIAVVGPNYASLFDFLLQYRLKWGSRFEGYWTLEAIFNDETAVAGKTNPRQSAQLADVADWTRTAADEDLRRWKPSVVLVERCADPTISCGTSQSLRKIDMLQWFEQDATFKADWAGYERCMDFGYYEVWYLRQDAVVCKAVASIAPHPNTLHASGPTG